MQVGNLNCLLALFYTTSIVIMTVQEYNNKLDNYLMSLSDRLSYSLLRFAPHQFLLCYR